MKLTKKNRQIALQKMVGYELEVDSLASRAPSSCRNYISREFGALIQQLQSDQVIFATCFQSRFDNWKTQSARAIRGDFSSIHWSEAGSQFKYAK